MKCQTCSHPQRQAIDQALLAENLTFEALSQTYGLSISALYRHKQHLVARMDRARQRFRNSQGQVALLKLNAILDSVQRAIQQAETDGNVNLVFKGAQVAGRLLRQIDKLEVTLELDTVHRLISSPQWAAQDSLLPAGPEVILEIRRAVSDAALAPCPDEDTAVIAQAAADAALNAAPEIEPKYQREKTAKLPKLSSRWEDDDEEYQVVCLEEKNLPKNVVPVGPGPEPADPPSRGNNLPAYVFLRGERYFRPGIF
jgi:uncharacterized protein (DUF1499 family)